MNYNRLIGQITSWNDQCNQAAMALSQAKRQEFLDYMWQGKRLGEAAELAGVSFEAANGIMSMNIKEAKYLNRASL